MTRDINELLPIVKEKCLAHIQLCKENGIQLVVTGTYRSLEEQNELHSRPFDGKDNDKDGRIDEADEKVTNARGGQSLHNWRVAYDVAPVEKGVIVWNNNALWSKIGQLGKSIGLSWGGDWKSFPDRPHFEYTLGYTWQDFLANKVDISKFNLQSDKVKELLVQLTKEIEAKEYKKAKDTTSYLFTELAKKV